MRSKRTPPLYGRIREILQTAKAHVARSVNTTQVVANWLIGREIVEEEQRGKDRAGYGDQLLEELSVRLGRDFGRGYSTQNLRFIRQFYWTYPRLLGDAKIRYALRSELDSGTKPKPGRTLPAPSSSHIELPIRHAARGELDVRPIADTRGRPPWKPGRLHANLSWTHYRTLLRVDQHDVRAFYDIEALQNNWSARELERQINSLLYERLALSRDKKACGDSPKKASR